MSLLDIFGVADKALAIVKGVQDYFRDKGIKDDATALQRGRDSEDVLKNVQKANDAVDDPAINKLVRDKYEK